MTTRLITPSPACRLTVGDDSGRLLLSVDAGGNHTDLPLTAPDVVELVQVLLAASPAARELIAAYSPGVTA